MSAIPGVAAMAAWLATYALHSTLLLGGAWLLTQRLDGDAWREALWKTALVGAIATSLLQGPLRGDTTATWTWSIAAASPEQPRAAMAIVDAPATGDAATPITPDQPRGAGTPEADPAPAAPAAAAAPLEPRPVAPVIATLLVVAWGTIALLLLVRLTWQHVRLLRAIADRTRVTSGPLPAMLAELRRHAGIWSDVRLTLAEQAPTPLAIGTGEICVPERFLTELEPEQQRTAIAHELAHLHRRDPLWQLLAGIIGCVFFFQPLNHVARRRMRDAAEHLADDWAVRQTGAPLGLARCLSSIASWVSPLRVPDVTLAMAEGGSPLLERVTRLTHWREPGRSRPAVRVLTGVAALMLVVLAAPRVSHTAPQPDVPAAVSSVPAPDVGDSLVLHRTLDGPFAARWSGARAQAAERGWWIGWSVPVAGGVERSVHSSSERGAAAAGTPTSSELLRAAGQQSTGVVLTVRFAGAGSAGIPAVQLAGPDAALSLGRRPLLWIGGATPEESLALLREVQASLADERVRAEVAAAIVLHASDAALAALRAMLASESSPLVRAEAIQWVPRAHGTDARYAALLRAAAMDDPSRRVQLEAVDALAAHRSPRALEALAEIARSHPDQQARAEAAQVLARRRP